MPMFGRRKESCLIADAAKVPCGYLAKILQILVRARVITSQRGLGGGFVLGVNPSELTLMDVVRIVDRSHRIHDCPLRMNKSELKLCALHRRLDAAVSAAERELGSATIADLAAENDPPRLCQSPGSRDLLSNTQEQPK